MTKPNRHQVALAGRHLVAAELLRRGAHEVTFTRKLPGVDILASDVTRTRTVAIKVKTKRKGNWQASLRTWPERSPEAPEAHSWVFVDLGEDPGTQPRFLVVPETWIQEDIDREHAKYLREHGGSRPRTPQSRHHSIEERGVDHWRDRWDLLRVFGPEG